MLACLQCLGTFKVFSRPGRSQKGAVQALSVSIDWLNKALQRFIDSRTMQSSNFKALWTLLS